MLAVDVVAACNHRAAGNGVVRATRSGDVGMQARRHLSWDHEPVSC